MEAVREAAAMHAAIVAENYPVAHYSDPQRILKLQMPSIHFTLPIDRFRLRNNCFTYMGRAKFHEIMETLAEVKRTRGLSSVDVYGTVGSGKVSTQFLFM
jgi:hypothetical protein